GTKERRIVATFRARERREAVSPSASSGVPTASYWLAGGSVIALGAGVFFEVSGLSARRDLEATCKPTRTCAQSDVDSARTRALVGDIAIGTGLALLGGAALFYVTRG